MQDNIKLLYHLCKAYLHYKENSYFPEIEIPNTQQSLHSAGWNSRAIYAFLNYVSIPSFKEQLEVVCNYVNGAWHKIWLGNIFNENDFSGVEEDIKEIGYCKKVLTCLKMY